MRRLGGHHRTLTDQKRAGDVLIPELGAALDAAGGVQRGRPPVSLLCSMGSARAARVQEISHVGREWRWLRHWADSYTPWPFCSQTATLSGRDSLSVLLVAPYRSEEPSRDTRRAGCRLPQIAHPQRIVVHPPTSEPPRGVSGPHTASPPPPRLVRRRRFQKVPMGDPHAAGPCTAGHRSRS